MEVSYNKFPLLQEELVAKSSKKVIIRSAISVGTVFRPAATNSPSLEHKAQNCHDLHMVKTTDFKFTVFENCQSAFNIL